jgi:hypothetical protein
MSCKLSANDPVIAMIAAGKRNQADQESTDEFSGRPPIGCALFLSARSENGHAGTVLE